MSSLKLFNSLSGKKEKFLPREEGRVSLYVCGMTVYDECHLGHARVMVFFDVFTRLLKSMSLDVTYVRNITDIDDKIIKRAQQEQMDWQEITRIYTEAMLRDEAALGVARPTLMPKATDYMSEMIAMIQSLVEQGSAYPSSGGDVYFSVESFGEYGELSKQSFEDLSAGARVDVNPSKKNPLDFVLWKAAKEGEPYWPSPWGNGRPGWHIECSAMVEKCFGQPIDIHGGGVDLKFPHHENERAQSMSCHDHSFVHTWMHVGHLSIDQEKMSKSLGNYHTIASLLEVHHPEVLRFFLLSAHYRRPLDYSEQQLRQTQSALFRLYQSIRGVKCDVNPDEQMCQRFLDHLMDDVNTPAALSELFHAARTLNSMNKESEEAQALASAMIFCGEIVGLLQQDPDAFLQSGSIDLDPKWVAGIIQEREQARTQKDYARADQLRQQLLAMGVELEDSPEGTRWRIQ